MSITGSEGVQSAPDGARSVQSYIDETTLWRDGTPLSSASTTSMQSLIWTLAAAGEFFEGLVVFMTGVAMPLIADEFGLTKAEHGVVGAATLFGILVGAIGLGGLSDVFGRKRMFVIEMFIFLAFLCALTVSPSYLWLVVFLFGLGVALGCDYPTAHVIISESIPSAMRGRLVLGAFGFQALGALIGAVIGFVVLENVPEIGAWRWMYAVAVIPALIVAAARFRITESAHWLLLQGRRTEAEAEATRLVERTPAYPRAVKLDDWRQSRRGRNASERSRGRGQGASRPLRRAIGWRGNSTAVGGSRYRPVRISFNWRRKMIARQTLHILAAAAALLAAPRRDKCAVTVVPK
jgi:MFS family permease